MKSDENENKIILLSYEKIRDKLNNNNSIRDFFRDDLSRYLEIILRIYLSRLLVEKDSFKDSLKRVIKEEYDI